MSDFAKFYALLKQLPYAEKEAIVSTYSGGETTSLREFKKRNPRGFGWMLADLESKTAPPQPSPNNVRQSEAESKGRETESEARKRKYRSLILRAMQEQGIAAKGRDWSDVNDFVERFAGKGKSLSNMSLEELQNFNRQVHKLLDWHNTKREIAARTALMN